MQTQQAKKETNDRPRRWRAFLMNALLVIGMASSLILGLVCYSSASYGGPHASWHQGYSLAGGADSACKPSCIDSP